MIAYDGSESADAALDDLRMAGLPRQAEALIVSVGEVMMMPPSSNSTLCAERFPYLNLTHRLPGLSRHESKRCGIFSISFRRLSDSRFCSAALKAISAYL
jgi:hypothetical protein